jgi:aminopeptidase N
MMNLRAPLICAAWLIAASGAALGADDRHGHSGAWWDTQTCCADWSISDDAKVRASFDEATGRSLLNYPPHRFADHLHMKLEVRIADMNSPRLDAVETLTLAPIGAPLPELTLNCGPRESMQIASVEYRGADASAARHASFTQEGEELRVAIDPPVPVGERFNLVIAYTLTDPQEGMTWTPESPAWPGRAAQLHTQGQPESNRYWFPCHDSPNERLTTEIVATVPSGFTVVSNGRLADKPTSAGADTIHRVQDKDHVNYLVTLVVGKFDVVDVGGGKVPMPVYAPQGLGGQVTQTYGRTGAMVRTFEKIVDEPFPWDKYAQVIVHNFGAGGMENTSATSMYDTAILDRTALLDGDLDGLIAHELAHQWFGDLITCNSWEHIWLNEGFATFFASVWFEERDGIDAYMAGMYQTFKNLGANDHADAPFRTGMCSKEYAHPWDVFRRPSNPYPKGASILHMLRTQLGDKLFLDGLRLYVDRAKGRTVETDDLRYAMEEVSGLSLDRFFRQWCTRPGVPTVDVNVEWDAPASQLKLTLEQKQNIDGYNPAFFFTLPVWIQPKGGSGEWVEVKMDARTATATFPMRAEPAIVAVNANLALLADVQVHQPADRWVTQLDRGPTAAAKMQAIDALRELGKSGARADGAAEALNSVVRGGAHHSLRAYAAGALLDAAGPDAYFRAVRQLPSDARLRAALVNAAPDAAKASKDREGTDWARFLDDLRRLARKDESHAVRAAALRALGEIKAPEGRPIIIEALEAPSQHDQIRCAALSALASLDDAEGLDAAIHYTAPNYPARTRPEAAGVVGRLAHHDRAKAIQALVALLGDREARTARAAGEALVSLGGPDAEAAIKSYEQHSTTAARQAQAQKWLRSLAAQASAAPAETPK